MSARIFLFCVFLWAARPLSAQTYADTLRMAESKFYAKLDEDRRRLFLREIDSLTQAGFAFQTLNKKDRAPLFSLTNVDGRTVSLSDLLAKGPVVVYFIKGTWHPACASTLREVSRYVQQMKKWGASVVAISSEKPSKLKDWATKNKPGFYLLHDTDMQTAEGFRLVFGLSDSLRTAYQTTFRLGEFYDPTPERMVVPAVFVITPNGKITYASVSLNPFSRPSPDEVIRVLEGMGLIPADK
jgi:peroxiredoxin